MRDIDAILEDAGITGEQAEKVKAGVLEGYRTIAEVQQKAEKVKALTEENAQLADELAKVKELDGSNAEQVAQLKESIAQLQAKADERKAADEEKAKAETFAQGFEEATKGKAFAGDLVREAVMGKARKLSDANPDLSIADAIDRVVGDGQGVWANPQRDPHKMPTDQQGGGVPEVTSLDQVKTMTPDDINRNWGAISALLKQQ